MRKLFLALTILLAMLASACGDDGGTDVGSDPTDPTDNDDTDDDTTDDTTDDDTSDDPTDGGPILGAGPYPIADLTVTITLTDGATPSAYRIACLGDTATLTGDAAPATAESICLRLNESSVKDRIVLGEPDDRACTEIYGGPETATIAGTFDGVAVATDFHRTNGCGIGDWDLLGPLLPDAG